LIVLGSPEAQQKIADLLKKLDNVPPPMEEQIKGFALVHADPASAATILKSMGPRNIRVATDERTRQVFAAGSMEDLNVAEALMMKLDEGSPVHIIARYEVRVIWLAGGLTGESKGEPPADDLKDVVAELSRLGIKDPRQVGQMVVQTTIGGSHQGKFAVKSSPRFGDQMADFNAAGLLSENPHSAGLWMQIRLQTSKEPSPPGQNLSQIETQIVLPEKQYVVLATAPTGNQTSAFVVQVTGDTKASSGKKSPDRPR